MPRKTKKTAKREQQVSLSLDLQDFNKLKNGPSLYTAYDSSVFENKHLPALLEDSDSFSKQFKMKNRFNQTLQSALTSTSTLSRDTQQYSDLCPDPLFGAVQRLKQNAPSTSAYSNPFNISFEIPPLPKCTFDEQDPAKYELNFFSFVKPKENNLQIVAKKKSAQNSPNKSSSNNSPNYNRRQIKQKFKKSVNKTKISNIWEFMPQVNEELLEHNLKTECGIQRMWEDESIDLKLRDLRISECGLLTIQKASQFEQLFKDTTSQLLEIPKVYSENSLIQQSLLMLQGVPGSIFQLEEKSFTFRLNQNFEIDGYSLTKEALQSTLEPLIEAGCFFLYLKEFVDYFMKNSEKGHGMIIQNFVLAIQDFLVFYQNSINDIQSQVLQRRTKEDQLIFNSDEKLKSSKSDMTILELVIHMSPLLRQIKALSSICLTQSFIDSQQNEFEFNNEQAQIQLIQRVAYSKKTLLTQYPLDIAELQIKSWQTRFPVGAPLLTYLYRILLCCDSFSDLETSDLLRLIFQKTIEPLLVIIKSFIYTGDFEDPHGEFFIKKIYRGQRDAIIDYSQDFIFMMTSETSLKIPVFLKEVASTIFKAGSSLHLLRKKQVFRDLENFYDSDCTRLYYDICSVSTNMHKISYKAIQNTESILNLEFKMGTLKQILSERQQHYDEQIEKLSQAELLIFNEEQHYLFSQLQAREQAKLDYQIEWEHKQAMKLEAVQEKKKAYLQEMKVHMNKIDQQKALKKHNQIAEREAYRKEMEEYERRKESVKEELKKQYQQILIDNQKVGDLRSDTLKKEEESQQDLIAAVQALEAGGDSPCSPLVISNANIDNRIQEQPNNLANLVAVSEFRSIPDIDNVGNLEGSIQLDDIEIIDMSQPINQEATQCARDIISIILSLVNSRIDEIRNIDTKRRTWNKIRKVEKVQEIIEKRSKWRYQEPQVPIRSKLNAIFEQFKESKQDNRDEISAKAEQVTCDIKLHLQQKVTNESLSYKVPLTLALQQCVIGVVKDQYKLINKCLIHMIFRKLRLLQHLEALRNFYFCFSGDLVSLFMQSIFNDDVQSSIKDNTLAFVNNQLEITLKMSVPEKTNTDFQKLFGSTQYLSENFEFQIFNKRGIVSSPNFYFTAFNMGEYMRLNYKRRYPLDMVISDQCLEKYNAVFFFLLKLKRIHYILSSLWKYLNSTEFRRLPIGKYSKVRRVQILRSKMQHFISVIEQYSLTEVIQSAWVIFKQNLSHQTIFEDLIKLHNEFLDSIKHQTVDIIQLQELINLILEFNHVVRENGTSLAGTDEDNGFAKFTVIEQSFEGYMDTFYRLIKKLSVKSGSAKTGMKQLHLLLDFNRFYDNRNRRGHDDD